MTHHATPDRSQPSALVAPDFAALEARAAARTPERDAERQARLDSWEIGTAAMALGEQNLAEGDLVTARSWFEMAAAHQAPDAQARLTTIMVLAAAIADADTAAADTELAAPEREPHQDRDDASERLDAAAQLVLAAQTRAESIIADAEARASRITDQSYVGAVTSERPLGPDIGGTREGIVHPPEAFEQAETDKVAPKRRVIAVIKAVTGVGLFLRLRERYYNSLLRVDRIAELDRGLQNVLAGLDGMTHVLSNPGNDDRELLSEAVREEIARLRSLLDQRTAPPGCEVEPVLTRIVTLRRTNGLDIELDVEPGLRTAMPADAFVQVVSNLLANCERHAPGSKVLVSARSNGRSVEVEVRDEGPGPAPEVRGKVFRKGVRDRSRGSSGLGLHLSQQLVGASGGSLSVRPAADGPGTVAALAVPSER